MYSPLIAGFKAKIQAHNIASIFARVGFFAPLKSSLALAKGTGSATFSRATTSTVMGYAPNAVSGATQVMLSCAAGEARFSGARRISAGVWAETLSDGTPIPEDILKGYLAEPTATNSLTYSEQFDTAAWTSTGGSITPNTVVAPDGTLTADTFTETSAVTAQINNNPVSTAASQVFTISVFIKYGTRQYLQICGGLYSNGYGAVVDLIAGTITATGAVGTGVYISSSITAVNGYYRITITGHCGGTVNAGYLQPMCTDVSTYTAGLPTITPSTKTYHIWGAQLELSSFATSYIPTTTVAVTRYADVLTYQTASNFSDAAGAMYAEATQTSWADATGSIIGNATQGLMPLATNSGVKAFDGTNTINGAPGTPTGTVKMGASWGGAAMSVDANGGTVSAGSYDGAWGLTTIGVSTSGCGNVKNVRIWQTQLSDENLKGITT